MTVIIVPQSRPSTRTHEFIGVTDAGREVSISVVAAVDIHPSAVLADIRSSMPGISGLSTKEADDPGIFGMILIMFLLWIFFGVVVAVICLVIGEAGFVNFNVRWPDYLPIMGGERIGRGLFRAWVAAIPLVAVIFPMLLTWAAGDDLEKMKVGR
jgi:hypothetical protein